MTADALVRVGRGALDWVESNLLHFNVTLPYDDSILVREIKPIAELGLTCDLMLRAGRLPGFDQRRRARFATEALAHCWKELGRGEHLRHLLLKYPDLFALVTVYPPFWRAGFRSAALGDAIRSLAADPSILALEFPAWRLVDFAAALGALEVPSPWRIRSEFERTWLGQLPAPWMLSDSAAYSLTHTVFYLTDFGFNPSGLPGPARKYVARWIRSWSTHYARVENLDLLGEMLMVGSCLGVEGLCEPQAHLAKSQRANGAVPGPEAIAAGLGVSCRARLARTRFLLDYHTTLVALMASILALRTSSDRSAGRVSVPKPRAQQQHAAADAGRHR